MAEFDPLSPKDADEAAYAQALLGHDAGREQRHARLMAALPRPEVAAAVPVSDHSLAWRWQPYALGLLVTGLLVAGAMVLKGRPAEPQPQVDPRLAAAAPASTPAVVVAQADAPAAAAPPVAARIIPTPPPLALPPPVVVAEAAPAAAAVPPRMDAKIEARAERPAPVVVAEAETRPPAVIEPTRPAMPAPPPAAAAPPPAAPVMAAAPPPPKVAADVANQADAQARSEVVAGGLAARAKAASPAVLSLAASDAADAAKPAIPANASLLAAVGQADLKAARSALQAGASVQLRDTQGRTVLMLAARAGSRELVELLIGAGARKADRDPQGWMAADHAQAMGHAELAELLR